MGISKAPQYAASKHGVLGLMRAIDPIVTADNIRIAAIHPWFAGMYCSLRNFVARADPTCVTLAAKTRLSLGSR